MRLPSVGRLAVEPQRQCKHCLERLLMDIVPNKGEKTQPPRPMGTIVFNRHPTKEMRLRLQWVCWRYELIDNKWKKPPYDPRTGRRADTTKRQQWSTYKEAARACLHGSYDGIGYVFQAHEGYIRIDFDNCRNPKTGQIDKWAMEIVTFLNSYTEISPSGDGIHILAKGRLRGRNRSVDKLGAHQLGKLEMYANSTQYFTWTNNHLDGTPDRIEERSHEAEELYDIAFWEQLAGERRSTRSGGVGQPPPGLIDSSGTAHALLSDGRNGIAD